MVPVDFSLYTAAPEIALLVAASIVLLADVFAARNPDVPQERTGMPALLAVLAPVLAILHQMQSGQTIIGFGGMYIADTMAHVLKLTACIATAVTMVYAGGYNASRQLQRGEFQSLSLLSLLGILVMISANSLLVVYLGLELMSLSLYALAALRRDWSPSTEAAMKYFVLGALASGFMLYGMSMLYGATGSLELTDIARTIAGNGANRTVLVFGVVFVVAGLAFKFGAVPFHMWVPDVYEGTSTGATLLIAGAPKLAAFAITFRMLVEALSAVSADWSQMLMLLAVASLALGNIVGVAQSNLKRLLAYSTIAQIGFVLLGLAAGHVAGGDAARLAQDAYGSAMFYVVTYVLTTLAGFGAVMLLARAGFESDRIEDLKGLSQRAPWLSAVLLLVMFSLAGIPPTVGFYSKLVVLQSVVAAGHVWLAVLAVLLSLIGAFYYLRVVKTMFFDAPVQTEALAAGQGARALLGFNGVALLVLGLLPGPLMTLCVDAIRQALAS